MAYVNGLHDLSDAANQARKQAARAAAEQEAAARHAANQAVKQAARAAQEQAARDAEKQAMSDPIAEMFGWSVPKKLGGIPTWMLMAGGLMAVMFVFGGKRR